MAESMIKDDDSKSGVAPGAEGRGEPPRPAKPGTWPESLAASLSELFTRRRQSRPGLYAPLVRLERGD